VDLLEKQFDYFSLLEVMAFEELWIVLSWDMQQVVFCCSEKTIAPLYKGGNAKRTTCSVGAVLDCAKHLLPPLH
jgi:hypothetical protein